MKKVLLVAAVAVLAACVNTNKSQKPKTSGEPAPVETDAEQIPEPVQSTVQPVLQPADPVKAEVGQTPVSAPEATPEVVAPVEEKPRTVDALCQQYGVYGLLSQYDRYLRNGEKKKARKIEDQLWEIEKRVKNDKTLPEKLRSSFKDYVEDKEDEIEDRY